MGTRLELGDCLDVLKTLDASSVDAVVTDPPYGLSFMGKTWDYDVPSVAIWQEVFRVLKPGGYLLSFAGTRTQHRMAVAIEDAGFEIRDMIAWVYGSGFPKSLNIGKAVDKLQGNQRKEVWNDRYKDGGTRKTGDALNWKLTSHVGSGGNGNMTTKGTSEWEGWGTALKPALEPITVARKPIEGTVAENCLKWGVGGIDIDGSRVVGDAWTRSEQGTPDTMDGIYAGGKKRIAQESNPQGRFPANLIHDGSEEVVGLFPETKSGSKPGQKGKSILGSENGETRQEIENAYGDSGSAARFFYCAKASKSERNKGCEGMEEKRKSHMQTANGTGERSMTEGFPDTYQQNNHPTVKPIALMEYLVNMVSREGQTVLDPFLGSGSTGIACTKLGRDFIGIEREAEYLEIAKARIAAVPQRLL